VDLELLRLTSLRHLGLVALALGDKVSAEAYFARVIAAAPQENETRIDLAVLQLACAKGEEALNNLHYLLPILPDSERVKYYYALTLRQLGRFAEAEPILRQIIVEKGQYASKADNLI
jgi:tetratricopeptide (TPR) repeat protein